MFRKMTAGMAAFVCLACVASARAEDPKVGDAPPKWRVSEAKGIKRTAKVADYNGKWLVIVFWAYDNEQGTKGLMPSLMSFWDKDDKLQDKYAVLTFHMSKLKTFKQLDKELEKLEKESWDNRKLPFPIMIDASGQTPEKWGVKNLPTVFVIDPEGKIAYKQVGNGNGAEKFLAEKLGVKYEGAEGNETGESAPVDDKEEKKAGSKEDDKPRNPRQGGGG